MTTIDINGENWDDFTDKQGLVVVDFWHEQCPWCKKLNPEYEALAKEYEGAAKEVTFTKFNILESPQNQEIAKGLGVMSTPTILFFCHGRPVSMTMGYQPKEQLKETVEEVLNNSEDCINKSSSADNFYI